MVEKAGREVELSGNILRDQLVQQFENDRYAVRELMSLVDADSLDFTDQKRLAHAAFDTSMFETTFRMAMFDGFRAVSAEPTQGQEQ